MHLYAGTVAEMEQAVVKPEFIAACEERFARVFGVPASPEEVRSWRRSWPPLMSALSSAGLNGLHVLLEYSLPGTGERVDVLVMGIAGGSQLCAVVVELKQWTHAQTRAEVPGLVKVGDRVLQHPARQAGGYVRYLEDWVSPENMPLLVRGIAVLHDASADLVRVLRELSEGGPSAGFPLLGRDDLVGASSPEALARRLACEDLRPAAPEVLKAFLEIEHRPSPALLTRAGRIIEGHESLVLLGDQDRARQEVLDAVTRAQRGKGQGLIIVTGGPGTGKTVVACRLLGDLCTRPGANPRLLSPSGTLTRQLQRVVGEQARGLIATFVDSVPASITAGSVVLIDEAHRIRTYPHHRRSEFPLNLGKLIGRAAVTVLFLDERQIVRPTEGITLAELERHAKNRGLSFAHIDLVTQFRCNGSLAYQLWVDDLLQPIGSAPTWTGHDYDLAVASDPDQLGDWIDDHTRMGRLARITAGFCWPWETPSSPPLLDEVQIDWIAPDGHRAWARPWNFRDDKPHLDYPGIPPRPFWATDAGGHNQVGCIYTAQGMEYSHSGVVLGDDLVRRQDRWVAQPDKSHDHQLHDLPPHRYLQYALNTYRVLATRGTQSTRIYSIDPPTQGYLQSVIP